MTEARTRRASPAIGAAFRDPVLDAQRSFRALLAAMAEPGKPHRLAAPLEAPAAISQATAILLLTLADQDTPIWIQPSFGDAPADYVRFHTGARDSGSPAEARFAVISGREPAPPLESFPTGEEHYPDRSATVIVEVQALEGGARQLISGPGIRTERAVAPSGLRDGFWHEVALNHARFPLGIDLILACGTSIMALPRSTAVRPALEAQ